MLDIAASVPGVLPWLVVRNYNPEKTDVSIKFHLTTPSSSRSTTSTEFVPVYGEENRWFAVGLLLEESSIDAHISIFIQEESKREEIASSPVDLVGLKSNGRIRISFESFEVKLVICYSDGPSPFQGPVIINPVFGSYIFPGKGLILREICGEVRFLYSLTFDFMNIQMSRLANKHYKYEQLKRKCRLAQGLFLNDDEALEHLSYPCNIRIIGIRDLIQSQRVAGSKSLSSPFVSVSITTQGRPPRIVGRTNTEYRTTDPVFGTNTHLHLCEHSNPVTQFESGRFGKSGPDGNWLETYLKDNDTLQFTVYHERHSVMQGITFHPMAKAEISFKNISQTSNSVLEITLVNENSEIAGTLFVVAYLTEPPSTNPFDSIGEESVQIISNPNLLRIPTFWLGQIETKIQGQLTVLSQMIIELGNLLSKETPSCFKSSEDKKSFSKGCITTNLHQCDFSIASTVSPFTTRSRFAYTTCGVPTAHVLGLENISLGIHSRNTRLGEYSNEIGFNGKGDVIDWILSEQGIVEYGEEAPLSTCPLMPPCSRPSLNILDQCGSQFHQNASNNSQKTRTTSTSLRSAAASFASRFGTTNNNQQNQNYTPPSLNKFHPVIWQIIVEEQCDLFLRESIAVSQALPPTASAFISECILAINKGPRDAQAWGNQLKTAGFLIGWESLISTHGAEMCMLNDVIGVMDYLNSNCTIICEGNTISKDENPFSVSIESADETSIQIRVKLPLSDFQQLFSSNNAVRLQLTIVLFSQGVNETQSISNLVNKEWASFQNEISRASVQRLAQYCLKLNPTLPLPLVRLNAVVNNQRLDEKEVEVLLLAEDAVRYLKGARQVMCKSGKDRTAMAVTLEQSRVASNILQISSPPVLANLMREFGVRIRIAEKNIGVKLYSFNIIQRMALPKDYRPPLSVIQDMASSYWKKDVT